jgi:hypothetical protein
MDVPGRRLHLAPGDLIARVEIEDDAIRMLGIVDADAPGMELDRVHLHQVQHTADVADVQVLVAALDFAQFDWRARPCPAIARDASGRSTYRPCLQGSAAGTAGA